MQTATLPEHDALDLLTGAGAVEVLGAALAADGASLDTWRVHQVHARPGAETSVGYDVVARRETPAGAASAPEYLVATTAVLSPELLARAGVGGAGLARPGVVRLDDGERVVHVWRHPVDPLLPGLAIACDAASLGRVLADHATAPGEVPDVVTSVEMVAYRPLRRAVLRVRVRPGATDSGAAERTLYVKVVRPDRVAALVTRHELFGDPARVGAPAGGAGSVPGPGEDGTVVGAPVCRAWTPDGVVVLEEAHGPSLAQHLASTPPAAQATAIDPHELLRALGTLPAAATGLPRRPAWSERSARYARSACTVQGLDAGRVQRLERSLRHVIDTTGPGPVVATHGDFYEANVLLDAGPLGPRVRTLLDVDTLGPGHRIDDLACMVGHLAVLPTLAPDVYAGVGGLVDRCLAVFGEHVDPAGLRARAAAVVLSLAVGAAHRDLAREWLAVAESLLDPARSLPESPLIEGSFASHGGSTDSGYTAADEAATPPERHRSTAAPTT